MHLCTVTQHLMNFAIITEHFSRLRGHKFTKEASTNPGQFWMQFLNGREQKEPPATNKVHRETGDKKIQYLKYLKR